MVIAFLPYSKFMPFVTVLKVRLKSCLNITFLKRIKDYETCRHVELRAAAGMF